MAEKEGERAREREKGGGGGEDSAEKAETEGDSKGLITGYHLDYNLYHTNLQRDFQPHCWRMIREMKG